MRILLTGSNGLLGQKLVNLILATDHELLATGRGPKRFSNETNYRSMDISSKDQVFEVFKSFQPEAVIHTAAMTNVDECELNREACEKSNVLATQVLVDACKLTDSFLLALSTDFIFDGKKGPLSEEEEASPVNYYGETKLRAEGIIVSSGLKWAIARTVLVYGVVEDMSRSNIILWVRDSLQSEKTINVVDDQFRTPTLAEDLADGCLKIVERMAEGIYNISGKDFLTPYEMALQTAGYFDLDKTLIHRTDSSKFKQPAARPLRTGFILDKARKQLDYKPHSFLEGIEIVAKQIAALSSN